MPSTKKKSPMSTNKKKKPVSSKASTKKRASSKKNSNSDTTSGDVDGSYLHNVSHTASGGEELLDLQSLNAGSEVILSTLKRLEESNRRIVERMDRIEGNSSASSTPIPSQVAKSTDNVTFRLPRPKHTSPVKKTLPEMTPRANLLHSYKWPAREEVVYPGTQTVTEGMSQRRLVAVELQNRDRATPGRLLHPVLTDLDPSQRYPVWWPTCWQTMKRGLSRK